MRSLGRNLSKEAIVEREMEEDDEGEQHYHHHHLVISIITIIKKIPSKLEVAPPPKCGVGDG